MGKAAARKKTTTTALGDVERSAMALGARQQFLTTAVNMGWQLAITILVPVFIGVKLDDHFHTTPSYTLAALVLAITCAIWVVSKTIKQVSKSQASKIKEKKT